MIPLAIRCAFLLHLLLLFLLLLLLVGFLLLQLLLLLLQIAAPTSRKTGVSDGVEYYGLTGVNYIAATTISTTTAILAPQAPGAEPSLNLTSVIDHLLQDPK